MRKKIALFLSALLLLTPIYASSLSDKRDQLNNAKESIQDSRAELKNTKQQKEQMLQEIQKVDKEIVGIENKILDVEKQLKQKEVEIDNSQKELDAAVIKKDQQYSSAKKRMVQMYKNQKIGYIQIIFSSKNFWDAINRVEYIKRISNQDNELITSYQKQVEIINTKKQAIEDEKSELDVLYKSQIAKKGDLKTARSRKDAVLTQLAGQEERLQAEIQEMQEVSKKLEQDIKRLTQTSTIRYTGGTFNWPVPGWYTISSEYNPRISPISGRSEFHTGIDIPASYGTPVVAAADGVVITSGWVNGFGNTIMINHGSGIVTLYGHNSSLAVSEGQTVSRGQTVSYVGSTGYSTGNHCHFEVRINGEHTSPWPYLK